jgi:GAF domain-containing protein
VTSGEDLLVRLASAIASAPLTDSLSARLCRACRDLTGADAAAITVSYASADRVTLHATDELVRGLEDLQDVVGEGPGVSASQSGRIEVCPIGAGGRRRWPLFDHGARRLVPAARVHAIPMRPDSRVLGVLTLCQADSLPAELGMDERMLLTLAAAAGAALVRDPTALDEELEDGPWTSRAAIHQATGMVVAQLRINTDDALAVLRAHAYAGETTLADIAGRVTDHSLTFTR